MTVKELKKLIKGKSDDAKVLIFQYYEQEWINVNQWNLMIEDAAQERANLLDKMHGQADEIIKKLNDTRPTNTGNKNS